jgi:hypothetical protein
MIFRYALVASVLATVLGPSRPTQARAVDKPLSSRPVILAFAEASQAGVSQSILAEVAASHSYRLLPVSALAPLLRQRDAEEQLIERAESLREEGRQALLALDQAAARAKLDAALSLLERSFVRFYAPSRLAELRLIRGVAALRASRPDLARQEFVKARQLDATLEPDAHYSPQVRSAYAQAITALPARPAPTPGEISAVIEQIDSAKLALVLIVETPDERHTVVQVLIFDPSQRRYTTVESVPLPSDVRGAERASQALGRRLRAQLAEQVEPPVAVGPTSQPNKRAKPPRPWYKRWYVWAAAAAVVAGTAVAIPFAARRDVVDLEVSWPPAP